MTLLEEAKKIKVNSKFSYQPVNKEQLELVIGWLSGEISYTQLTKVLKFKSSGGNYLYYIASMLKRGYQKGLIKIEII